MAKSRAIQCVNPSILQVYSGLLSSRCEQERCPNPIFKSKDRDKHRKKYHQPVIKSLVFQGTSQYLLLLRYSGLFFLAGSVISVVHRDPSTSKFPCPCGAPEHSRFSSLKVHLLCRQNPHPADPHAYPDSDDESAPSLAVENTRRPNHLLPPSDLIDVDMHDDAPTADLSDPPHFPATDLRVVEPLATYSQPNRPLDQSKSLSASVTLPQSPTAMEFDRIGVTGDVVAVSISNELTPDLLQPEIVNNSGDSHHTSVSTAAEARILLKANGIDVEPQFRLTICIDCAECIYFDHIFGHRRSQHCENRKQFSKLGAKESLTQALEALDAHEPLSIPSYPIPPIRILPLLTAYRCGVEGCQERKIFSSTKLVYEHCAVAHMDIPARRRPFISLPAQRLGKFRGTVKLIEVIPPPDDCPGDAISEIIRHFNHTVAAKPATFQLSKNIRGKSEFLAKTRWDIVLQDVDLRKIRAAVRVPDDVGEPLFVRLKGLVRKYYHGIASGLDRNVSTLTLRHIHSADPE